ncbi:MAG: asparagine synthase [Hyphomicrobium sp.]|nr:asparagine synthase [Hyphomicrobium sp.]
MYQRMQVRETGWEDVYELQGGECLTLSQQGESRAFLWAPQRFCHTRKFENPTVAANELRSVVHACLISWASNYDRIVEQLSGGFDSAVLLSGLRRSLNPSQIICAHHITPGHEGDERDYARAAAAFSDCELVEYVLDPSDVCVADNIEMPTTSRPSFHVMTLTMQRAMASLAQERHADVIMAGHGGDQLFYNSPTPLTVADYFWRRHGLWRPIGTTKDRAIAIRSTIPAILVDAFQYGVRKQPYDPYQDYFQDAPFLNKEAFCAIDKDRFKHTWIKRADGIPPGKVDHILGVIDSQHCYHDPLDGRQSIDVVHPLISQPIFELCLAIPSYVLASGRLDRGLARQAFAKDVPPKILNRHTKGVTTRYFLEAFSHNAEFVRELLLDGELVNQKLILRDEIEPILMEHKPISLDCYFPFFSCIATEAWLRSVSNATPEPLSNAQRGTEVK